MANAKHGSRGGVDVVVASACPGLEKNARLNATNVQAVQRVVHARGTSLDEIEAALRLHGTSHSVRLQTIGETSDSPQDLADATCNRQQLAGVLASMESRYELQQSVAWEFRSLDEECTGRLPLHRCVVLFACTLGSKFSRKIWNKFRNEQVQFAEEVGDLGGASLEEVRLAVLNAYCSKHDELGLTQDEVRLLVAHEEREYRERGLRSFCALDDGILVLDEDMRQLQRLVRGQELRKAAERRLAAFRELAMTSAPEDGADEPDTLLDSSLKSSTMDTSRLSMASMQSNESFAREKRRIELSRSVWEALEDKYNMLSLKLLSATMPRGEVVIDLAQLQTDVSRLMRAGRLEDADQKLSSHSDTPDIGMLLGPADQKHASILASSRDFLHVSTAHRSVAELHVRQSRERNHLSSLIEGEGKGQPETLRRKLHLQQVLGEAEESFEAAALLVGLQERGHRPGTLNRLHPDRVRCCQLAKSRLPSLLKSCDEFKDFTAISSRISTESTLTSGEEDKASLHQMVLKMLILRQQTERLALIWLLQRINDNKESNSALVSFSLADSITKLTKQLQELMARRHNLHESQSGKKPEDTFRDHQAILSQAASLAVLSSWRWCHDQIDMPSEVDEDGSSTKSSKPLLIELLTQLQELQLEELESTMAEAGSKDCKELYDLASSIHTSLMRLEIDNVASVLLRPPVSEEQWRSEVTKTTVQVKYLSLQEVFLMDALGFGDGTAAGQKEWNTLPLSVKKVEFVSLRLEELASRLNDEQVEIQKVDHSYHRTRKASVATFTVDKKKERGGTKRTVPRQLEDMCRRDIDVAMELSYPVDKLLPAAVQVLVVGAPCFDDAMKCAFSSQEVWSMTGTALQWQCCYAGWERLRILGVNGQFSDELPYLIGPDSVVKETLVNRTLVTQLCRQVEERQTLATLIPLVLRLSTVWREVSSMAVDDLKSRLSELSSSSLAYWQQGIKSRRDLDQHYAESEKEAAVFLLRLLQDESSSSGDSEVEAASMASPALQHIKAISKLWQLCFAIHAEQLKQTLHWLTSRCGTVASTVAVLRHAEHQLKHMAEKERSLSMLDELFFWQGRNIMDPYANMLRASGHQLEAPGTTVLASSKSSAAVPLVIKAINLCPEQKVRLIRRHFLELVTQQHDVVRKERGSASSTHSSTSVMDNADLLCILERSLDLVSSVTRTDEIADILALHPGAEDSFQELCWLMSEVGLMPEHKEKVGEMEKSTAAVSIIQTLADFSERQKQQLRKWSIGVSQSSSERVLETLQVALGYQLHILTMCQKCHDINSALLLVLIKSMMSLRTPRGHSVSISYSTDWYYHNQMLAQRCVQLWQTRQCLALTYEAELTELISREQRDVQQHLNAVPTKARLSVGSRVTLVQEVFDQLHSMHAVESQVLLLILQLCDLNRPGLTELTEQSPATLKEELNRIRKEYENLLSKPSKLSLDRVKGFLESTEGSISGLPLEQWKAEEGLDLLHEAAAVRVVLTMWQLKERESKGGNPGSDDDDTEPMAILLLRQLVSQQQQFEDGLLRETVDMDLETLRHKLCECLSDRVVCNWKYLAATLLSGDDYSETVSRDTSSTALSLPTEPAGGRRFSSIRMYRVSTTELYGALDTVLQSKMKRKNRKVRRKRSSMQVLAPTVEDVTAGIKNTAKEEQFGESTVTRTKEYEDKHRLIMSDLLTTYNKLREAKLRKQEAAKVDQQDGTPEKKRSVQFGSPNIVVEPVSPEKHSSQHTLQSASVAKRLEERKASRQRLLLGDDADQKATDQGAESDQDTGERKMSSVSQKSAMGSNVEGDDSGDDVDLPEMSGDSLTDDSEDDSEKDGFRPLTSWGRPATSARRASSVAGNPKASRPATSKTSGTRPLSRFEESKLNKVDSGSSLGSGSSASNLTAGQEDKTALDGDGSQRRRSNIDESTLQLKQQMLKGRTAVDQPMVPSAEPDDKGAVRTSTTTRELASKEKGRQRQEAMRKRRERLAARAGGDQANTDNSNLSPAPSPKHLSPAGSPIVPRQRSMHQDEPGADEKANPDTDQLTDFEALRGTMTSRLQVERGRQQKRLKEQASTAGGSPEHAKT